MPKGCAPLSERGSQIPAWRVQRHPTSPSVHGMSGCLLVHRPFTRLALKVAWSFLPSLPACLTLLVTSGVTPDESTSFRHEVDSESRRQQLMKRAVTRLRALLPQGEKGITGLETAVLLSAITVASSVLGVTYLRASMSASDQIQTGVMRLLGSGEGSLLASPEMLAQSAEEGGSLEAVLSALKGSSEPQVIAPAPKGSQPDLQALMALLDLYAEEGIPFSITLSAGEPVAAYSTPIEPAAERVDPVFDRGG